jgi:hypothetical protein
LIDEASRVEILLRLLSPCDAPPLSADTLLRLLPSCDVKALGADTLLRRFGHVLAPSAGIADAPQPTPTPVKAPTRRPQRKSGLYTVLQAAQQHGFTPPQAGHWLMLPPEFAAVLALEHKAIAQVVLEILQQTIGTVEYGQDGHSGRKEWAPLTKRHFVRAGILSRSQAEMGLKQALAKGYITRRSLGARRFEYAIRWKGTN